MNYFELYPGDYRRDTGRLSLAEHGAYLLLMADYYASEKPLPGDIAALCRIVGAQGSAEQKAVKAVADQYFPVSADGLRHNGRADREIERFRDRSEKARASVNKRWAKVKPKNELDTNVHTNVYADELPTNNEGNTHGNTHHKPQAITGTVTNTHPDVPIPEEPPGDARVQTVTGLACRLMRDVGCLRVNPSHPDLIAALAEGVSPKALQDAARQAVIDKRTNPFAYAIAAARGQLHQASQGGTTHASSRPMSAVDRVQANLVRGRAEHDETHAGGENVIVGQANRVTLSR